MVDLTLRWEKFGLSRGLHEMMGCGELVDVTIMCQGEVIQAHKNVLAACSQQLRQIFKATASQHPIVVLKGVNLNHFKSILKFMYLGEATVAQDDLPEFLATADELGISALCNKEKDETQRPPPEPPEADFKNKPDLSPRSRLKTQTNNSPPVSPEHHANTENETNFEMDCDDIKEEVMSDAEADEDWTGADPLDDTSPQHAHHIGSKMYAAEESGPSTSHGRGQWLAPSTASHKSFSRHSKTKPGSQQQPSTSRDGPPDFDCIEIMTEPWLSGDHFAHGGDKSEAMRQEQEETDNAIDSEPLRRLLAEDDIGRLLLKRPTLTPKLRNQLGEIIVKYMLVHGGYDKIYRYMDYLYWADQIPCVFPFEKVATYYVKYSRGTEKCFGTGILVLKLASERRKYRTFQKSSGENPYPERIKPRKQVETAFTCDADTTKKLTFLEHNCEPWNTVTNYWNDTFDARQSLFSSSAFTFVDICSRFLPLSDRRATQLFEVDFKRMHPHSQKNLTNQWPLRFKNFLKLEMEQCIVKLNQLQHENPGVSENDLALMALPFLFPVTTIKRKKGESVLRPTATDRQQAFINCIRSVDEAEDIHNKIREKALQWNTTILPFVFRVGDADGKLEYYVSLNGALLMCDSLVSAVDSCFKSFFSLHAPYPVEASIVWEFLSACFYNIPAKGLNKAKIEEMMSDLARVSSKK